MIPATFKKNDKTARLLIFTVSFVVFTVVVLLSRLQLNINLGFDIHVFALINAGLNSAVAMLLIAGLIAVRQRKYILHKKIMITAIVLSSLFLVSYIAHHLLAGETKFGGEGMLKTVYLIILFSHISLAAIILPFILFTAYRALTGEFSSHKKLSKITWPIWFYVAVSGPIVYYMIRPYYG